MHSLLAAVQASTLASDAQSAADFVTCTLPLSELTASLRVEKLDDAAHSLTVEGKLPAGDGLLSLLPEQGVAGAVRALAEIEVDEPAVDRAWVIRGDGPALLVSLVSTLLPLAAAAPCIDVEAELVRIRFLRPVPLAELGERVHQALALWERIATFRLSAS